MRDWDQLPRTPGTTNAPCKDCTDRETTCHVTCGKYITWAKRQEELRESDRKKRNNQAAEWARDRSQRKMMWERRHKSR